METSDSRLRVRMHEAWLRGEPDGVQLDMSYEEIPIDGIPEGSDLRKIAFRSADLRYCNVVGCDLREADLRQANCQESTLRDCDMRLANCTDADLSGCDLTGCRLDGAVGIATREEEVANLEAIRTFVLDEHNRPDDPHQGFEFNMATWIDPCSTAACLAGTIGLMKDYSQREILERGPVIGSRYLPRTAGKFYEETAPVLEWLQQRGWVTDPAYLPQPITNED